MKLDIISLVFLLIIFISVISGFKKGFFKILVNVIKSVLSFVLAILLAKPIANILMDTPISTFISSHLEEIFLNQGGIFAITITDANKTELINQALIQINIPEFLSGYLTNLLSNVLVIDGSYNLSIALATTLTSFILMAIAFIIIFIIVQIIISILKGLFKAIEKLPVIGLLNRFFGAIINGVLGVLLVCAITFIFTLIVPLSEGFAAWLSETALLNDDSVFTLSKFFYENNFLLKIIAFFQNLFIQ